MCSKGCKMLALLCWRTCWFKRLKLRTKSLIVNWTSFTPSGRKTRKPNVRNWTPITSEVRHPSFSSVQTTLVCPQYADKFDLFFQESPKQTHFLTFSSFISLLSSREKSRSKARKCGGEAEATGHRCWFLFPSYPQECALQQEQEVWSPIHAHVWRSEWIRSWGNYNLQNDSKTTLESPDSDY